MARTATAIPLAIAGLSTFIHACMTILTTYQLIQVIVILAEPTEDDDDDSSVLYVIGGFAITILVISMVMEIGLLVVSVMLILGIKRERPQFIAPWVYMVAAYTILNSIALIKGANDVNVFFGVTVFIIIVHAAMWYPIFKFWRDLLKQPNASSPLNVAYTTTVPGTIYNPGPNNWQQDQTTANYYPPPGYGQQTQTGSGYYPMAQNYADGQIQPSTNPQVASANYPRQVMASYNPSSCDKLQHEQQAANDKNNQ